MLRISGRMRLVAKIFSKITISAFVGLLFVLTAMFMKYKFVYKVKVNRNDVGYVASKIALEDEINNYVINGDSDNVGYVVLNSKVDYEMMLVDKNIPTNEAQIFAQIKDDSDVYYKVYAIIVDGKEKGFVESIAEAQEIVDEINEMQSKYADKAVLEIEEKYLMEYDVVESVTVAVNDIFEPIKEVNEAIKEIRSTPAAVTKISDDAVIALKENLATLDFDVPVKNSIITSRYGWRTSGYHYGLDLAASTGTSIEVAEAGKVTYAGWLGNYGYLVKVEHTDGYETYYAHCSKIVANVGDVVEKGDLIAYVGSTGRSTGPHLHLEIRYEGTALNPEIFIYD